MLLVIYFIIFISNSWQQRSPTFVASWQGWVGKDNWAAQVVGWRAYACMHNLESRGPAHGHVHAHACWPTACTNWAACVCLLACCSASWAAHACGHRPAVHMAPFWISHGLVVSCSSGVGDPCLTASVVFLVSIQLVDRVSSIQSCKIRITLS